MLRNMEYVYEVYKQGSFTKAAKSLYVSQPCLSALVKKTEEKLGFPIFNRNSNPLQLTECGQEYIRYIERMRALENEFDNYLNDLRGLKTGKLSIGFFVGAPTNYQRLQPPLSRRQGHTERGKHLLPGGKAFKRRPRFGAGQSPNG